MKKSTILVIFIIYVASIVAIGFFGMSLKNYDEVKYVKSIEMSAEAENENMFDFVYKGVDKTTKNPCYELTVHFSNASTAQELDEHGNVVQRKFLQINLIPKVTYDTGDESGAGAESIVYSVSNEEFIEGGRFSFDKNGTLVFYEYPRIYNFDITVNPLQKSGVGKGANITVRFRF